MTYTAGSSDVVSTSINDSGYAVMTLRHPPVNWYSVHYTATDPSGLYDSISLRVKTFSCTDTMSVTENSAAGTKVGAAITATDVEGDTLTYSLSGTDAAKFEIGAGTGQITVKAGTFPITKRRSRTA